MQVLGIDPGSGGGLGWAVMQYFYGSQPKLDSSGVSRVDLPKKSRDKTALWLELQYILRVADVYGVDLVAYEQVVRHSSVYAAHLYGGQVAIIQLLCAAHSVPFMPVPVQTVKKVLGCRAAGKDKEKAMVAAAHKLGYTGVTDHNEADAIGVALGAIQKWTEGKKESSP